jgi:hypothetical protein
LRAVIENTIPALTIGPEPEGTNFAGLSKRPP